MSGIDHEPLTPRSHLAGSQRREQAAASSEPADDGVLKGAELDEAVRKANEDGAEIKVSGTADERRAALAEFEASKGESGSDSGS